MMLLVLVDASLLTECPFALYNKKLGLLYLATIFLGNSTDLRVSAQVLLILTRHQLGLHRLL